MRTWLIHERKNKKLTQLKIAELAGISRAYYAQIELGQRDPSIKVAKDISRVLSVSWSSFYEEEKTSCESYFPVINEALLDS